MMNQELKKCPCCPSGKGQAVEIAGMWIVRCNVCGITTQLRDTLEEAATDWNRRPEETCPCCGHHLNRRSELMPYPRTVRLMNAALKAVNELDPPRSMQLLNQLLKFEVTWRPVKDEGAGENEGDENVTTE